MGSALLLSAAAAAGALLIGNGAAAGGPPAVTAIDLGTINGATFVQPYDINDSGEVVGLVTESSAHTFNNYAFSWTPASGIVNLGSLGGFDNAAAAINASGQIVGWSTRPDSSQDLSAVWWNSLSGIRDLGDLGGVCTCFGRLNGALAINDQGQVTGYSYTVAHERHAFLWTQAGGMTDLGTLGGDRSEPTAISQTGEVVGDSAPSSSDPALSILHAFAWTNATGMIDLGTLGGSNSVAQGVNGRGEVVGASETAMNSPARHAFVWSPAAGITDLGTLGGTYSFAQAINASGEVVGSSETANGENHAFVWTRATGMVDIGSLGGNYSDAIAVNDSGEVIGDSYTSAHLFHAFYWTPLRGMVDLGTADPSLSGSEAIAINAGGQIVGMSFGDDQGSYHGTLWQVGQTAPDTIPPSITAAVTPAPNANGWNRSNVTVTFSCSDADSGVASCPVPQTLSEGANQSVTGTATDNAGNSASATVSGVNVDQTPPTLAGSPTTNPNANGWYSGGVTVHWVCSDSLSGIAGSCPADEVVMGEGASLTANQSATDLAGNIASAASAPIRIDQTSPMTAAASPSGWSNTSATVALSALDNLSGVAATYYQVDGSATRTGTSVSINDEGIHSLMFWSVDHAGNAELPKMVSVRIDKTAPTISHTVSPVANGADWNKTAVTVTFVCGDSLSGVAFCTLAQQVMNEGQSQPVQGVARDNANNTALDTAFVSIDKTPPTINTDTDRPANSNGWYNAQVQVSFYCSDVLSGIANCPAAVALGEGAGQSTSGTATDAAGNSASAGITGINIDKTPPVVEYVGNAGTYTVDQNVNITCTARDALSGVAATSCADVTGPAWSFGLGSTSRSASAADRAGNTGAGSTSFTIVVTSVGLDNLILSLFGSNQNGASGLIAKADAITSAPNANARNGALGAFDNQVDAKVGNPLTAAQASALKQLAAAL